MLISHYVEFFNLQFLFEDQLLHDKLLYVNFTFLGVNYSLVSISSR